MDARYDGCAGAAFTHYHCRGRVGFITYIAARDTTTNATSISQN